MKIKNSLPAKYNRFFYSFFTFLILFLLHFKGTVQGQGLENFCTYYEQRYSHFITLPDRPKSVIFLGDSITDSAEWSELFGDLHVLNRGISGDNTAGVLNRFGEIIQRKPAEVFLMIGIDDLAE